MQVKDGEYYWLDAGAIDSETPLMIGQFSIGGTTRRWYIGGKFYTAGTGIDIIKHIPNPKLSD